MASIDTTDRERERSGMSFNGRQNSIYYIIYNIMIMSTLLFLLESWNDLLKAPLLEQHTYRNSAFITY